MSRQDTFRNINKVEKKIIQNSFSRISLKLISVLSNLEHLIYVSFNNITSKEKFPLIYLITNKQREIIERIDAKEKITSGGLYFGFLKKGDFFLSLEGAEFLYKQEIFKEFKRIYINEKGEKSILYGNNILKNMVFRLPDNLEENDFLLVLNKKEELIAIATSQTNSKNVQKLKSNEVIAVNLSDKGYYLRKKQ